MTTEFELEQFHNRALVAYYSGGYGADLKDVVEEVFETNSIEYDAASDAIEYRFETPREWLDIALEYGEHIKQIKVGGEFESVNVAVFFYNQPAPPLEPEIDFDDDTVIDDEPEPEPEPTPSLAELICAAMQNELGGIGGASTFVIPKTINDFVLRVE